MPDCSRITDIALRTLELLKIPEWLSRFVEVVELWRVIDTRRIYE